LELLIELGANVNVKNQIAGATPLHCAVQSNKAPGKRMQMVQLLVQQGKADLSLRDESGALPFFYCREDDGDLKELLRPVAGPSSVKTIKTKNVKQVHTNLHRNNIMTNRAPPEWDRLLSACQKNDPRLVRQLVVVERVSPSHSNRVGQSALHVAALWGHGKVYPQHRLCFSVD
jgi:ankyrin repeat protein